MRTIEVSDDVYERLQRAATERGVSVETYVGDLADDESPERLFTPEFVAEQHRLAEETRREGGRTVEEVWAGLVGLKAARTAARAADAS